MNKEKGKEAESLLSRKKNMHAPAVSLLSWWCYGSVRDCGRYGMFGRRWL